MVHDSSVKCSHFCMYYYIFYVRDKNYKSIIEIVQKRP